MKSPQVTKPRLALTVNTAAFKTPTTTLALEHLISADDLLETRAVAAAIKRKLGDVRRALRHLHSHHAVDYVLDAVGEEHWFATPQQDTRTRHVHAIPSEVHKPHAHGNPRSLPKARASRARRRTAQQQRNKEPTE